MKTLSFFGTDGNLALSAFLPSDSSSSNNIVALPNQEQVRALVPVAHRVREKEVIAQRVAQSRLPVLVSWSNHSTAGRDCHFSIRPQSPEAALVLFTVQPFISPVFDFDKPSELTLWEPDEKNSDSSLSCLQVHLFTKRFLAEPLEDLPLIRVLTFAGLTPVFAPSFENWAQKEFRRRQLEKTYYLLPEVKDTRKLQEKLEVGLALRCKKSYPNSHVSAGGHYIVVSVPSFAEAEKENGGEDLKVSLSPAKLVYGGYYL